MSVGFYRYLSWFAQSCMYMLCDVFLRCACCVMKALRMLCDGRAAKPSTTNP